LAASNNNGGISWKSFFNLIAYTSLVLIAIALIIIKLLKASDVTNALQKIAEILAYMTVAFYAFFYANRKRGNKRIVYLLIWVVAVALIVIHYLA